MKHVVRFFALVVVAAGIVAAHSTPVSHTAFLPGQAVASAFPTPTCCPWAENCPVYR